MAHQIAVVAQTCKLPEPGDHDYWMMKIERLRKQLTRDAEYKQKHPYQWHERVQRATLRFWNAGHSLLAEHYMQNPIVITLRTFEDLSHPVPASEGIPSV